MFEVNDYVTLRTGIDAQVYTVEEIDGFWVKLKYKCGSQYSYTETDVCRLLKPSKEQMEMFKETI